MKLLSIFLLIPFFSIGQIVLTSSDLPSSGQNYYYSTILNTLSFDVNLTGQNYTWDISSLQADAQDSLITVPVSSTPLAYQLYFNNFLLYPDYLASYAQQGNDLSLMSTVTITDRYDYYKVSSNSFSIVGFGANVNGLPTSVKYDVIDELFSLPLVYGIVDSSSSNYLSTIPSIGSYGQWINRNIEVDGWGQLITPNSSFDVLRLKTTLSLKDTVFVDQLNLGTSFNRPVETIYQWYSNGVGAPVFSVTVQAGVITQMKYLNQIGSLLNQQEDLSIALYPNPIVDELFIDVNSIQIEKISICSIDGSLIREFNNQNKLSLSFLDSGCYILNVRTIKGAFTKKFIKL